jgi:protein subunit release factor A
MAPKAAVDDGAMAEAETLLQDSDPAMRSLASEELAALEEQMSELLQDRLPALLLPPSSTAALGAMIELHWQETAWLDPNLVKESQLLP